MSMIGGYRRITSRQFDDLQAALNNDPDAIGELLFPEEDTDEPFGIDLEIAKTWHGIQFLLDSHSLPYDIVFGGTEIGEDLGYGPARYLTPPQVKETSAALEDLDKSELQGQFNPVAFEAADIYPGGWTVEEPEKVFDWLWGKLTAVREFFQEAAQQDDIMLLYLS